MGKRGFKAPAPEMGEDEGGERLRRWRDSLYGDFSGMTVRRIKGPADLPHIEWNFYDGLLFFIYLFIFPDNEVMRKSHT